jgi:hypothetical protein
MRKLFLVIIVIGIIVWVGGYLAYTFYFPKVVAQAIVSENKPTYLPKRLLNKIEEVRGPVNKSTENFIVELKKADIPMTKVYDAIENTTEEQAYQMLDELNDSRITEPNQAFDIFKKHIHTDFDLEPFRASFNQNVDPKMIRRIIKYANMNRSMNEVDIPTAKAIAIQLLREKEKEMSK